MRHIFPRRRLAIAALALACAAGAAAVANPAIAATGVDAGQPTSSSYGTAAGDATVADASCTAIVTFASAFGACSQSDPDISYHVHLWCTDSSGFLRTYTSVTRPTTQSVSVHCLRSGERATFATVHYLTEPPSTPPPTTPPPPPPPPRGGCEPDRPICWEEP